MNRSISLALASAFGFSFAGQAAEPSSSKSVNPEVAYVRILNGCDTSQAERWRTGVDLKFKEALIGSDIRLGESGPLEKISFSGRDTIDVYRAGNYTRAIAGVPATLQKGGFYTLVVMGNLERDSASIQVAVVQESPLPPESVRSGFCRMVLVCTVSDYPVAFSVGQGPPQKLLFGEQREFFLPPGEMDFGVWFVDSDGKTKRIQAGLSARAGANLTTVIHPSPGSPRRPAFCRIYGGVERALLLEGKSSAR